MSRSCVNQEVSVSSWSWKCSALCLTLYLQILVSLFRSQIDSRTYPKPGIWTKEALWALISNLGYRLWFPETKIWSQDYDTFDYNHRDVGELWASNAIALWELCPVMLVSHYYYKPQYEMLHHRAITLQARYSLKPRWLASILCLVIGHYKRIV